MITPYTAVLKLHDDDWKALGVSSIEPDSVAIPGLTEGVDYEIDYVRGLVRRLREVPNILRTVAVDYDNHVEDRIQAQTEAAAARDAVTAIAQTAVGVGIADLTTAQQRALLACLLYKADALGPTLAVKPLSQWVRR